VTALGNLLFAPVRIGALDLPNRIVMAPLTRSRASSDGCPSDMHATYYGQRSGAGLIVTEATQISAEGQGYSRTPGIYTERQTEAWRPVVGRVREAGGRIVMQFWHVGRIAHPGNRTIDARPVAPSPVTARGTIFTADGLEPFPVPRALGAEEIARVCADYARAARNAIRAGFDGVEIHAANGYLIDQFLHDGSNRRDDRYGGSIENRVRFLIEVAEAVGAEAGFARVGVRLSPFGAFNDVSDSDPSALFDHAIRRLDRLGLAYLHVINAEVAGDRTARGGGVDAVAFARGRFGGPLIAAGGYDQASAGAALASGAADLIAFGRAFISNPDLPRRMREGWPLAAPDRKTFYTAGPRGYIDYPASSGHETPPPRRNSNG
jgi:N-ethylmaleimide reductase